MLTVEKFLCCFGLEKSLIVICWIDIIACIIMGVLFSFFFGSVKANGCTDEIKKVLKEMMIDDCEGFLKIATTVFIVTIILFVLVIYLNYLLIKGAKTRNHKLILIGLIVAPFTIFGTSILYIASGNTTYVVTGVLTLICGTYFYICLYSLYVRFRDEKKNINQQP